MSENPSRTLITAAEAAATPPFPGRLSALLLEHGTMQLRWYAPKDEDKQTPHEQDELYIVASGTGWFRRGPERVAFAPHDALFVRAGEAHCFEDTSADFGTWVIFYGAKGGEGSTESLAKTSLKVVSDRAATVDQLVG
ncbi:MAG: cupin domain-containing protein [Acetobacteraceae bacterium]|nr:cupin domain-containing protein [Acetobacteraceae bacterium]